MAFPNDLLEQAKHLAIREKKRPRQASLCRAVSTAYYALFHLLTYEATLNWKRAEQRAVLARFFEHGKMNAASEKQRVECDRSINAQPPPAPSSELDRARHLRHIADTLVQTQQQRHRADYDNSKQWTRTEVLTLIALVEEAFQSWRAIREEPIAQAYLISLLAEGRKPFAPTTNIIANPAPPRDTPESRIECSPEPPALSRPATSSQASRDSLH